MKIGIAQINTKVGNIDYNIDKIQQIIKNIGKQANIIVFPESTIGGYPMNDLLEFEDFVKDQRKAVFELQKIVQKTNQQLKIILGFTDYNPDIRHPNGHMALYNASAIIGTKEIKIYHKHLLPNYDVFFEKRWFLPGKKPLVDTVNGQKIGLTICEDIWDSFYNDNTKPLNHYKPMILDWIINISSSPFSIGKPIIRYNLIKQHQKNLHTNFAYVNQVGGQDELVFDGGSMLVDKNGKLRYLASFFQEEIDIVDWEKQKKVDYSLILKQKMYDKYRFVFKALVLGLQDYLKKNNLNKVIIGLSGGIDSAISLYLLSKILLPENIICVYMPTKFNTDQSYKLSKQLAENLQVQLKVIPIQNMVDSFNSLQFSGVALENLQARIRGDLLTTLSNQLGGIVINNTNETELILGYGTAYGDLTGAIGPLGNLNKKEIYEFARWINRFEGKQIIPEKIITRPPSAELSEDQIDPFDYNKISEAVYDLFFGKSPATIQKKYGLSMPEIKDLLHKIKINEWKRKQAPLVIKLKDRAPGIGRIFPIAR